MIKIKQLTKEDVKITIEAENEHTPIEGNAFFSDNVEEVKQIENEIREKLEYNIWAWCCVKVTVTFMGMEGTDYLGACSYDSEEDFIKNSGYYDQMIDTCIKEIQTELETLVKAVVITE